MFSPWVSHELISLLRYMARLWPLALLFVVAQIVMRLSGSSGLLGLPHWLSLLDFIIFILVFGCAAVWVYWPMVILERRGKERSRQGRMVGTVMAHLPLRSLKGFIVAGVCYASYLLLILLGTAAAGGGSILTPHAIISLAMPIYFSMAVLIPSIAFATTVRHELDLRLTLGHRETFPIDIKELHSLHYFTDSSRRPWLVFFVTGLVPTSLLAIQAWMVAASSQPVEQHFIAAQGLVLFVVHILASTYLIFLVSQSLKLVIMELAKGLEFMRQGNFGGRVPVLVDDDLGELAKGLNTALQGLQEREDLKDSLKIATEIQQGLLPGAPPDVPGYAFCAFEQSCYSVGGDYYDFITFPDGRIWLLIADVAGKGYPSALTVANLQAMLHVLAAENVPFDKAVDYINKALCQTLAGGRFVTLFMAKLQPRSHSLLWLNAGHVPPMLLTESGIERLHASTPPLGMMPEIAINPQRIDLRPGDRLFAYTDGVTEAHGAKGSGVNGEMFGDQRLADWLNSHRHSSLKDLPEQLLKTLKLFGQDAQEDDITLLCLQREDT